MKDSGIEWIGEIPDGWISRKLKYCAFLDSNGVDKKQYNGENLFKSVHYLDVYTHSLREIRNSNEYLIVSADKKKADSCSLKCGDVLMTTSSENPEDIGHSTVVLEDLENTLFGYHLVRIRPKISFDLHLLKYLMGSFVMRKWFEYRAVGMTRYGLSHEDIAQAQLIIPPIKMQHLIGQYLDKKNMAIDSSISNIRSIIEKLKEYRQSSITEAVTKGLHDVPMTDSGIEWIGDIPEKWLSVQFRRAVRLKQGLQIAQSDRFSESGINRFVYITLKYINSKKLPEDTEYIENPDENVMCTVDDILFVRTGATGQIVTNVYGVFHNNFFKILYNKQLLSKQYLVYYLSQKTLQEHFALLAGTTTIPDLNHDDFLSSYILIPPYSEQNEIVDYLNKKCAAIDKLIAEKEQVISKLDEYKKSLIYEYVTGKKEVSA